MSAIESITEALSGPNGQLSRKNYNERTVSICYSFPLLAAAIAELLEENSLPVPGPLRHARNMIAQKPGRE